MLGVGLLPLEVRAAFVRVAPSGSEQFGGQVARDDVSAGGGGRERGVAGAGGDVEDAHPGADRRVRHEVGRHRRRPRRVHALVHLRDGVVPAPVIHRRSSSSFPGVVTVPGHRTALRAVAGPKAYPVPSGFDAVARAAPGPRFLGRCPR